MTRKNVADSIREASLPPQVQAAFDQELSRRGFLGTMGALFVGFNSAGRLAGQATPPPANVPVNQVDSWVAILQDGGVMGFSGKCEFGQGFETVQHQLIAEELSVPLEKVWLLYCDTRFTPDQGVTSGSQSHFAEFGPAGLRQALATARDALFQMASRQFSVPMDQLTVADGVISVRSDPSRRMSYGQLIGTNRFNVTINPRAAVKDAREYKVLGTSVPRYDIPAKVLGRYQYVQNVRLPGMLHGKVVRPPSPGAKVVNVDQGSVANLPGNVRVVVKGDFVGVVADKEWLAMNAADALKVTWSTVPALPKQADIYQYLRSQPTRDTYTVLSEDVDAALRGAARTFSANYTHPFQLHGSLASSCAVANIRGTGATGTGTMWSATQGVYPQRDSVANVLGIPAGNLRVIFVEGSGCYGCNGNDTVTFDAAILSQAVGRPVRVQLTRKDEMAWADHYGPAYSIDLRAGVNANGDIIAWDYEGWAFTKGGRPNAANPGNIVTGSLAGFPTPPVVPTAAARPTTYANGNNTASPYGAGCFPGGCGGTGNIRAERVLNHAVASPFFTGPLRSPARLQNTFANEGFIDEIASALRQDPVAYRLRHLVDSRMIDVLNAAAKAANWDARPSPKPGNARTGTVSGRGISVVLYEGDNGYCALVAEVTVNQATGEVVVTRLVASQDSGPVSNPDGMVNQMEGGALQGMSRALKEEVRWNDLGVTSLDWRTYPVFRFGDFLPKVESVVIDRKDVPPMGSGECTITIVAASIANAIFDATGARIRTLPFTPDRVLAALRART